MLSVLKTQKNNHSSAKGRWKYIKSCFKENARTCSKNSTTQGNIRISGLKKRLRNLYEKNLQDELYQLENKQAKGAKLRPTIRWKLEGEKCSKTFFKVLERKNMRNQTRSEFILMIINQNKNFTSKKYLSKPPLLNFLAKFLIERTYLMNNFTFVRLKFFR